MPQPIPTFAYDASKAAVHMLTRKLATELADRRKHGGHSITVNAIAPYGSRCLDGADPCMLASAAAAASGGARRVVGSVLVLCCALAPTHKLAMLRLPPSQRLCAQQDVGPAPHLRHGGSDQGLRPARAPRRGTRHGWRDSLPCLGCWHVGDWCRDPSGWRHDSYTLCHGRGHYVVCMCVCVCVSIR